MTDIQDLIAQNRSGEIIGLPCFCTSNPQVIEAILALAAAHPRPTVIEATCNQVNQDGGYTGMTPQDYMTWVQGMAADAGVPADLLIMGGDHLGPNPWRDQPADQAMDKARVLVRQYVEAGFTKIHLDASMPLGGEPNPSFETIATRAADLCAVAEAHAPDPTKLFYIVGTEVPIPGGETEELDALDVTSVGRFGETIDTHKAAFAARGLEAAWGRVVSVVTQPGVDFSHTSIYPFVPEKAADLATAIGAHGGLTFEAHSTDYQSTDALRALVSKHFFFLKVGPELTFRFREAVYALAKIEEHLAPDTPSNIAQVIADEMTRNDGNWRSYYDGTPAQIDQLKVFSFSDRIRYYWPVPRIEAALDTLLANLSSAPIPQVLVSQYFSGLEFGEIPTDPHDLIRLHVQRSANRYFEAAGMGLAK